MNKREGWSLVVSSILHSILLGFALAGRSHQVQPEKQGQPEAPFNVDIIVQKEKEKILEKVPKFEEESQVFIPKKSEAPVDPACPHWFGGIGIQLSIVSETQNIIDFVYEGYPAYFAGLRKGDQILWVEGGEIKGELGTTVKLTILRQGQILAFSIVRGRICY